MASNSKVGKNSDHRDCILGVADDLQPSFVSWCCPAFPNKIDDMVVLASNCTPCPNNSRCIFLNCAIHHCKSSNTGILRKSENIMQK